jgi:polysaccharide biosynthesis protein PslG
VLLWGCCLAGGLLPGDASVPITDFDGPDALKNWRAKGAQLTLGDGHTGRGAVLAYELAAGASATVVFTPVKPIAAKHRAALSFWIRAAPDVKLTALVRDQNGQTRRYPFEAVTLENPNGDWRDVVLPLAMASTGFGDDDHDGAAGRRIASLEILAEPRYPHTIHGNIGLDDLRLLDSPDRTFSLSPDAALKAAPKGAEHLAPRLGVNIHGPTGDDVVELAHAAGFSFFRVDVQWRFVERNGDYRFTAYDRLLAALEARGMGALLILDYGHPQHGGGPPRSPDDVAAFARYAEAAANHFRGRNVRYEIWNEPNVERFWPPRPNAAEYATLARAAVAAIHKADPNARVAIGALGRIDVTFLAQMVGAGAAGDAVSVHPYLRTPEILAAELPPARALLGGNSELWDTEWGYASFDYFSKNLPGDGHTAAGRKRQAMLGSREALTVWALGLPVAVWYDLRDDGDDARTADHNYGLLDRQNHDKPAMQAFRALTHWAANHTFAGLVGDVPDGVHAIRLDGAAGRVFVVWNDQPDARITLRLPATGLVSATNLLGEPVQVKKNEIALAEVDGPIYLEFSAAR